MVANAGRSSGSLDKAASIHLDRDGAMRRQGVNAVKATRVDRVRESLADDMLSGRLEAGTRLDEVSLARRFEVSRTPVREALRELAAVGLVQTRAHSGAVVADLVTVRLTEMFEAVAELEAVCARLSALKMTSPERYRLEELHHQCGGLVRHGDAELYHQANIDFHAAIRVGCHNTALEDAMATLRRRFSPLSRIQFRGEGRLADSYAEHDEVVRAIVRGNAELAFQTMRRHVTRVQQAFEEYTGALASGPIEAA
jgi:DNA-binding GntR family transcriptional regulator